eukprot:3969312-Alexandrium_andersonii.AAC.1
MSASLVGSEMCIRDSRDCAATGAWQAAPTARDALGRSHGRGAGNCAASVSYTHLTLPTICSV